MVRFLVLSQRALVAASTHDFVNLAQSSAYSTMFSLFPALIVAAAIFAALPETASVRDQIGDIFDSILPGDVIPVLNGYFTSSPRMRSPQALAIAAAVSLIGASGVMATIMEGLRRAGEVPRGHWNFAQRRGRALLLVPLSLVPLGLASGLVVFGQWITIGLAARFVPEASPVFLLVSVMLRWATALAGVVASTAIVYHLGVPVRRSWKRTLPGACLATVLWFVITLAFGWYVTRFANYAVVYGSLGAGIALLIWLSIMFLSVLFGAEFNRQVVLSASPTDVSQD